jgi:DNA-binding FrmR family transcriptional regulator
MPTVTISAAVDKMMKAMLAETMEACVTKLSEKYGFDEKEALDFLENDGLKEKKEDKKKEKKEKKEVDPKKPKKTSGYLLYSADIREQVKAKLIEDGGEGKPKDVVQAIAAKWKELKDEEKAVWNDKAKAAKEPVNAN